MAISSASDRGRSNVEPSEIGIVRRAGVKHPVLDSQDVNIRLKCGTPVGLCCRRPTSDSRGIGTVRYPRIVARDADCAERLARRTLTNLYNVRPAWLDLAHRRLDAAVFAAYGWPADLSDDQLLARLLELNLARSAVE
jgi:hypothetical protein